MELVLSGGLLGKENKKMKRESMLIIVEIEFLIIESSCYWISIITGWKRSGATYRVAAMWLVVGAL